jgi:gliding motility-associated-like protein
VKVTSPQGCVAWDSIHAYLVRPQLEMLPADGRICPGDVATLTGHDADHYTWTASPADPSLEGQESAPQINVSPSVTTVYTMVGHGTNGCDATPLTKTVTIVPLPVPSVKLSPGFIDTDDPRVVLRDQSTYGVSSMWLFNNGETMTGREVSHTFNNCIGYDSVPVTLTSYNSLNCPTVYPFQIPVNVFTAWFPSAFTPGSSDGNDKFSIYTINEYQFFHIYIYNRRGELIYDSDDVHFEWDGTYNGEPCPQGAYVYTVRFRKPGTTTLSTLQGSVTLIR